jgi:hypothetical protein
LWRIWWAPNNVSKWQMGFNSAFKRLKNEKSYTFTPQWAFVACRVKFTFTFIFW